MTNREIRDEAIDVALEAFKVLGIRSESVKAKAFETVYAALVAAEASKNVARISKGNIV
jgi:hypothetical protein